MLKCVLYTVFASSELEPLLNPSEGFLVFNTGDEDGNGTCFERVFCHQA